MHTYIPINACGSPKAPVGRASSGTLIPDSSHNASGTARAKLRAAFYFDGFNMHGALNDIVKKNSEKRFLKWVDLRAIAERLIETKEEIVKIIWCTAKQTDNFGKLNRHNAYQAALETRGVIPILGHFIQDTLECRADCKKEYFKWTEKAGDVNVGVHAILDASRNLYDVCYLVTADSDQVATAKLLRTEFPSKHLVVVAPPERKHSQHLLQHATGQRSIKEETVVQCLFEKSVREKSGALRAERPKEYDPPRTWKRPLSPRDKSSNTVIVEKRKGPKKLVGKPK